MVKKTIKIYLEEEDERRLKAKANQAGFEGRGSTTKYIEKVCREPVVFLDDNTKTLLKALDLK